MKRNSSGYIRLLDEEVYQWFGVLIADVILVSGVEVIKPSKHGTGGRKMTPQEIDRIENAIRHIQTATDVDPWAAEIVVQAMRKQMPQKAIKSIDAYNKNLYKLYCPTCGALVANGNSRVGFMNKVSEGYDRCAACGQAIDWEGKG